MTARAIGDLLPDVQPPRDWKARPVHGGSRYLGELELHLWQPVDPDEINAIVQAAQEYDKRTRQPGRRNGALGGHVAIEVLEALYRKVDYASGRLEPAILTICAWIGRSKDAVVRALRTLQERGWVAWQRRAAPPDSDGGPPKQLTNAYVLGIPADWVGWVAKKLGRKPIGAGEAKAKVKRARAAFVRGLQAVPLPERTRQWLLNRAARRTSASHRSGMNPARQKKE